MSENTQKSITNREAFEAHLTEQYGEHSQYGGYESWGVDGSLADPPEPSVTIEHYYGSTVYAFVHYAADGEIESVYRVELDNPDGPARPPANLPSEQ